VLSAVLAERYGVETVSFHLGPCASTIDVRGGALALDQIERDANAELFANRPVTVSYEDEAAGLRKQSAREGTLRIVTLEGLDRSACGGTHVRSTGEVGLILLRKTEKVRDTSRIEFLCGQRALARAHADFEALRRVSRVFSSTIDDAPALVKTQHQRLVELEKAHARLSAELAAGRGRQSYAGAAAVGEFRWLIRRFPKLNDEARAEAQGFTGAGPGVFAAIGSDPASLLIASSAPVHAGKLLQAVLARAGGRGGGSAQMAQGSVANADALEDLIRVELTPAV
jgi:alanyl-tRNA synthetase